jgi:hypothetical protein
MNKIANIIFKEPLVNHKQVDYINYFDSKNDGNDLNVDFNLPTLFVGWNHWKSSLSEHSNKPISILEKEIIPNSKYWEFSFNEQKSQHISGIDMFVRNAPIYYFESNYEYVLIDPVKEKLFDKFNILNWYKSRTGDIKTDGIYTYKNDMTYILCDYHKKIYGIDHNTWDFFGMENAAKTFIGTSDTSPAHNIVHDIEGDTFAKFNEIFGGYANLKRYLVVLLSK